MQSKTSVVSRGGKPSALITSAILALCLAVTMSLAGVQIASAVSPTPVTGGDTISADGTYKLSAGSTGTITVNEGLKVTIQGSGSSEVFANINIEVGNGTTLTIENLYATQNEGGASAEDVAPTIDFVGSGALNIAGVNLIDNESKADYSGATINVSKGNSVVFGGTGRLYGYKSSLSSYIGGNSNEANGAITITSGEWFLKGTKTGAIIGGDSTTEAGDDITITGGQLYLKGVAKGALIGGSRQGKSGNVVISGGLIELYEDFSGPAIGAGSDSNAGTVTITGGSVKTVLSSNSSNQYGSAATFGGMPGVSWKAVKATNASDYALCVFDVSDYTADKTIDIDVDNKDFYTGSAYGYVTNEVKNPNDIAGTTADNWLENNESWKVTESDYGANAYPSKNGSYFVPENNLYLPLSTASETHTITCNGDTYTVKYNSETGYFESIGYEWYLNPTAEKTYSISTPAELKELAEIVNGTAASAGIAQDSFAGATITLAADAYDMSTVADMPSIGNATYSFAGTFDGDGASITNFTQTTNTGGYAGLFGNNSGTVKNFTITGTLGAEATQIGDGNSDNYALAVGYNTGKITRVVTNGAVYANGYAIGGVCGRNDGGIIYQCGNNALVYCPTNGYRVGGICGHMRNGATLNECYNTANILGNNYRNGCQGVGGILGSLDTNGTVYDCYCTAAKIVNGTNWTDTNGGKQGCGGIVGAINAGDVHNCYSLVKDVYAPGSGGIIIGKLGNGSYTDLFYEDGATAHIGSDTYTSANENADGSLIFKGAGLANSYNSGYTITNCWVKGTSYMQSDEFVYTLNDEHFKGAWNCDNEGSDAINNGYPVLAWQGGTNALPTAERVAGNTRYETAAQAALAAYKSCNTAILVSGENFPDALSANGLAGLLDCPILLTEGNSLNSYALAAMQELGVTEVIIVGGEGAISADTEATLAAKGYKTNRIGGVDRYDTSLKIYEYGCKLNNSWGDTCIVAAGTNYPDAMSIAGWAYVKHAPIILASAEGLSEDAQDAIHTGEFTYAKITGGTAVVSEDVEKWLKSELQESNVARLAGDDRYGTAAAIVEFELSDEGGLNAENAVVASGNNFPDALSSASLVAANNTVLLLVSDQCESGLDPVSLISGSNIPSFIVLGGTNAVSDELVGTVKDIIATQAV